MHGLKSFLVAMGDRPVGCTLDREDVNGNYSPGNCRWATKKVQQNNLRTEKPTKSGRLGVVSYLGRWKAQIRVGEIAHCIGTFSKLVDAVKVREKAEVLKKLGDEEVLASLHS